MDSTNAVKRSNANSGGPSKKKRKQKHHYQVKPSSQKGQQYLCTGQRGFLCTTNFNEKNAVKEALNLLNEYSDKLVEDSRQHLEPSMVESVPFTYNDTVTSNGMEDVEGDIAEEIRQLKSAEVALKFYSVDTGVPNVVFITTRVEDPVGLAAAILQDIGQSKLQKSRYLLRMLPVEVVCKASTPDMVTALAQIVPQELKSGFNSFQISFKARYNNVISRTEVLKELADVVMKANSFNTVDLSNPKFTIIVEVLKGHCCISVVKNYKKFKKFNLIEVASGFQAEGPK